MNVRDFSGNLRDFNGDNQWSVEGVRRRYCEYCAAFQIEACRPLVPREHTEGDVRWIFPIMWEVIQGIEEDDAACIALGVDYVEEDTKFPFGMILKSNTARALRRTSLTDSQKVRLRKRISFMLIAGVIPKEMREYAKLLRKIGVGEHWPSLERGVPRDNPYAMRFYNNLRAAEGLPLERM